MIREVELEDALELLNMQCRLDRQTKYMIYEEDERSRDLEAFKKKMSELKLNSGLLLMAEDEGEVIGFLRADRGRQKRINHVAYITIGILKEYRGRGIGTALLEALEQWSKENGISRMELTVMCHNVEGIRLYRKNGFEVEGIRKHAMYVDKQYIDEYYMAKVLE